MARNSRPMITRRGVRPYVNYSDGQAMFRSKRLFEDSRDESIGSLMSHGSDVISAIAAALDIDE